VEGVQVQLEMAAVRDLLRVASGFLHVREQAVHRLGGPEAQQTLGLQTSAVVQRLAHADAHVHLVGGRVSLLHVVDVVGRHDRDTVLGSDLQQRLVHLFLSVASVALQLEVVAVAEDVAHVDGGLRRARQVVVTGVVRRLARETGGLCDQALVELGEEFLVDARDVVEALGEGAGRELDEIAVPRLVLGQQDQVVRGHRIAFPVPPRPRCEVGLDADDRLHALLLAGAVELDGAAQVPVIRQGEGRLVEAGRGTDESRDLGRSVEQAVVAVDVRVDERADHPGSNPPMTMPGSV
jgi:hypothetical protein